MRLESTGYFASRTLTKSAVHAPSKLALRARAYLMLLAGDLAAMFLGLGFASWLRLGDALHPQTLAVIGVLVPIFMAFDGRGMKIDALEDWSRGLLAAYIALGSALAVVLFVVFCLQTSAVFSRLAIVGGVAVTMLLLFGWRLAAAPLVKRVLGGRATSELMIVDQIGQDIPEGLDHLDAASCGLGGALAAPYALDRLAKRLEGHDSVVVACAPHRREEWTTVLRATGLRAHILIPELHDADAQSATNPWGWVRATVSEGPMQLRDRIMKRGFDVALAVFVLVALAPFLALVALAIKLESPGPVFFVQPRMGQSNRMFRLFKFRSMHHKASDHSGQVSASRTDPRVTRVGRFIRRTSVDELPQLLNILRGEMSFVGPRPHALGSKAGEELFWDLDQRYWQRHLLPPGLTGLAQVRGYRGATPKAGDLLKRLSADLEYIRGWNVLRDLAIILRTLRVLVHKNAY